MKVLAPTRFNRNALIGEMALKARDFFGRIQLPIGLLLAAASGWLFMGGKTGAAAFAMISGTSFLALVVWRHGGRGLPLLPMFVVQQFLAYAVPILVGNATMAQYSESDLQSAGLETALLMASLAGAWLMGMKTFRPGPPVSYALRDFERDGEKKLLRIGLAAAGGATLLLVLQSMGLMDSIMAMLPQGSSSAITALAGAASSCGFFLLGMLLGAGQMNPGPKALVWGLMFLNCFITASAFLLSTVIFVLISITVGIFWTSGKLPWRFLILVFGLLSFLNIGKYAMRDRYWHRDVEGQDPIPSFDLTQMPGTYSEWIQASVDGLTSDESKQKKALAMLEETKASDSTGLLTRINNLQNLLYVIDAEQRLKIPPVGGDSYTLIPALLVPRLLWPNKPRTHEGQVLLNVHFMRQDLVSTYSTYVAWGLLPEAYGNFGPFLGSMLLGGVLGFFFAWMENATARKMVLSLEGFIAFTVFLGLANSVEMVASVLVPSIAQAVEPLVAAALPFVKRTTHRRAAAVVAEPDPAPEPTASP